MTDGEKGASLVALFLLCGNEAALCSFTPVSITLSSHSTLFLSQNPRGEISRELPHRQ